MSRPSQLGDCGPRPNCVSSTASAPRRRVGPWKIVAPVDDVWRGVREIVESTPRTRVIEDEALYLRAEARSRVFRFVDDLELLLDAEEGYLYGRSASRVGYSDRGVNRRRLTRIARLLTDRDLIAP